MRRKLTVFDGLMGLWIPYSGFIDIDGKPGHHECYDNGHQRSGFFVRRRFGMVELLQIGHCYLPNCFYGVSIDELVCMLIKNHSMRYL